MTLAAKMHVVQDGLRNTKNTIEICYGLQCFRFYEILEKIFTCGMTKLFFTCPIFKSLTENSFLVEF